MEDSTALAEKPLTPRQNARAVGGSDVRRVTEEGRDYLVFPIITAREMVLNYPENGTKELLPAESLKETVDMWAGTPLTFMHPENPQKTAAVPEAYTQETIGQVHRPEIVDGEKLRVEGWLDVEKANAIGGLAQEVVNRLRRGEEVATSPGYRTLGDRRVNGTYEGEEYDLEQGTVVPNHVAIFPDDAFNARCSPGEGCAAPRANATPADDSGPGADGADTMTEELDQQPSAESVGNRMLRLLGMRDDSPPDGEAKHNHGDCACSTESEASEPCSCDGEPRENAGDDPDDPEADDEGAEADETTDSPDDPEPTETETDMSDDDYSEEVQRLADESPFNADQLADMTDEQIEAISGGSDSTEEAEETPEPETTESPEGTESAGDADTEEVTVNHELKEQVEELTETVEELRAQKENAEKREEARIVANALDIEMEDAIEMDRERLNALADKYGDRAEEQATEVTTNYGAVPGGFEREAPEPSEEDLSHISAGTRSDYEARNGGDN